MRQKNNGCLPRLLKRYNQPVPEANESKKFKITKCAVIYYYGAYGFRRAHTPYSLLWDLKIYRNFQVKYMRQIFIVIASLLFSFCKFPLYVLLHLLFFNVIQPRVFILSKIFPKGDVCCPSNLSLWESVLESKMNHCLSSIMTVEWIIHWSLPILMSKQSTLATDEHGDIYTILSA